MDEIRARIATISDPRHASYIKHQLSDILLIIMCGVLSGLDTLGDLALYANEKQDFFKAAFGIAAIPSKATFGRILSMLDGKAVGEAILDILRTRYTSGNIIAVDGKAICSTGKSGNPHSALQILSAYLTESGVVLAQETIHEKSNEIPAFQQMLTYLDVHGKTVTADAMHCQRRTSEAIVARKGNYVFGLKENQPSLLADVRMYFEDADDGDSFNTFQTIEKNAGRIEKRICRKARDIAWLAAHKWPGLRSVFAVERIVDVRGMLSKETSYYISSSDASARELLGAVREHWKIESMHWLLDVTFSEDESRFLSENAHTTMNALRKFALTVHKNYLAASGKKRSLKANMLAALIRPENLLDLFVFL